MRALVFTAIGPDRPGLVEELAAVVAGHGGNWLESRMARLGGEFAGIVRVEIGEASAASLQSALGEIGGLTVVAAESTPRSGARRETVTLELVGSDRPGIVSSIASALSKHGVNVENLETGHESAPMSGETLFRARAKLLLPEGGAATELQGELEAIASDLMVDLSFGEPD